MSQKPLLITLIALLAGISTASFAWFNRHTPEERANIATRHETCLNNWILVKERSVDQQQPRRFYLFELKEAQKFCNQSDLKRELLWINADLKTDGLEPLTLRQIDEYSPL